MLERSDPAIAGEFPRIVKLPEIVCCGNYAGCIDLTDTDYALYQTVIGRNGGIAGHYLCYLSFCFLYFHCNIRQFFI